jgi:hypothetical protein
MNIGHLRVITGGPRVDPVPMCTVSATSAGRGQGKAGQPPYGQLFDEGVGKFVAPD